MYVDNQRVVNKIKLLTRLCEIRWQQKNVKGLTKICHNLDQSDNVHTYVLIGVTGDRKQQCFNL